MTRVGNDYVDSVHQRTTVPLKQIMAFFIPLGISASLVSLSHLIINSTLAHAPSPEITIAGYSIASSLFTITERPAVFLRQTCSALAEDRTAFRSVGKIAGIILLVTMVVGLFISYTPLGHRVISTVFNVDEALMVEVLSSYSILIFVTIFSAIRCLYHGIIIRNMQTKWLTIGMIIRIAGMYAAALVFMNGNITIGAYTGAVIFLVGMMIEAIVSIFEGRRILRHIPERSMQSKVRTMKDVFPFYRPLLVTSFISVIIGPFINALLGKTADIELAISSYSVALSITYVIITFFGYVHQIVLNFYEKDPRAVRRFGLMFHAIPAVLISLVAFTPIGEWLVGSIIGSNGRLLEESLRVLGIFVILALVFPWVDYFNGLVMLRKETRLMMYSQIGNVTVTISVMLLLIVAVPQWNGVLGALTQSIGTLGELIVLILLTRRMDKRQAHKQSLGL
ncbi:multi antimicrobial extrusion protein MatE [Paenibacillus marinisediminis]